MTETINSELHATLAEQKAAFNAAPFPTFQQRVNNLKTLKSLVLENQQAFIEAMSRDFGNRSADDSKIGDILTTINGINYTLSKLKSWMKPEKRHVGLIFQPASARVEYQPVGVVGIMVPWNYPLFLALGPLTAALAAGNHAMIKPSEYTPNFTNLLKTLINKYFPTNLITVIDGDASVAAAFSALPFDHLFFTGSTNVGRLVMKAAAENLVPVTLELGGKSPAIIDPNMNLTTAVERLILGKTLNSGQTCVAPDYIFCPKGKTQALIQELKARFNAMYPSVQDNKDYTSVVNEGQFERLQGLLSDAQSKGAIVTPLGSIEGCARTRQMPLTVVSNTTDDMSIMQQEIFGPLLPIIEYDSLEQVFDYISQRERPLALYIYSFDKAFQRRVLYNTHSGGVCINEAAFHVAVEDLPFGGVGASGMGNYHGIEGFKTFSHTKAVFARGKLSFANLLFPPFGKPIHNFIYKMFIK